MKGDPGLSSGNRLWLVGAMAAAALGIGWNASAAGPLLVAETFTATTANMTPAGVKLRIQVIAWQEAAARTEVVATLAAGADASTPLAKLPTVGLGEVDGVAAYLYEQLRPVWGEMVPTIVRRMPVNLPMTA